MSVSYKLAVLCVTCGHPRAFHHGQYDNGCAFELEDFDGSYLRCGCYTFIPVSDAIEPREDYL